MDKLMIKIDNVSKKYRLGEIGGTTLRDELQRWSAKRRGKEDPTKKIGAKDYNNGETFMALNGVSFEVKKGERVGIIGHNGAGKSTLLKIISRVTAPTDGRISLDGRVASMLEVGTGFHSELTGRENIYMNGAILGMKKREIDAKIKDIIDFSECSQFIDTPVKRYSSGMYVKLAFSVAAHLDSEIMIMDEVLAVGDWNFQQKCMNKMKKVAIHEGKTILFVSHNMRLIRDFCQRCIVLDHGQKIFDGDIDQAIEIYNNVAIETFCVERDLSRERFEHLPEYAEVKMLKLLIRGKKNTRFLVGEKIPLSLTIKANEDIPNLCFRLELRRLDDVPVGSSLLHGLGFISEKNIKRIEILYQVPSLVKGKYKAIFVLYSIDDLGMFHDYDAAWAFSFSVEDELTIEWKNNVWGNVVFPNLSLLCLDD